MSTPRAQILIPSAAATHGFSRTIGSYMALMKPRLLPLVLFTGLPAMGMAAGGWPPAPLVLATLAGTAMAAAAANVLNCYIERERDALMTRTQSRPLPAAQLAPREALGFGVLLTVVSTLLLWRTTNLTAAGVALAAILFYVFVYTIWLKPRTPQNIVIGGAAGAVAPLIADAAVSGRIGWPGWLLFLIIFFWTPPHFWAIALYRKEEYEKAGFPMLPLVIGDERTRWRILGYTLFLIPVTLAPVAFGLLGRFYLTLSLVLGAWFAHHAFRVLRLRTDAAAQRMFRVSLLYLFTLFLGMIVDLALRG